MRRLSHLLYCFTKPMLFWLPPEFAHYLALFGLKMLHCCTFLFRARVTDAQTNPVSIFGINLPNKIGLAAGFDKNGDYIDALAMLGFGFIEIGTVTPRAQVGNAKPRLFRLVNDNAIINRMGFNNKGVEYLVDQVKKSNYTGVLGINIGKNAETPIEDAVSDYLYCFRRAYAVASYIAINISSPNTKDLRQLQQSELLTRLLLSLKNEQRVLSTQEHRYVPLVVKVSPDLSPKQLQVLAHTLVQCQVDGIIATNTTIARTQTAMAPAVFELGGLSGESLTRRATDCITILRSVVGVGIPIIASGGVMDLQDAKNKIQAGASLVQLYTGLIFHGPKLIQQLARDI